MKERGKGVRKRNIVSSDHRKDRDRLTEGSKQSMLLFSDLIGNGEGKPFRGEGRVIYWLLKAD